MNQFALLESVCKYNFDAQMRTRACFLSVVNIVIIISKFFVYFCCQFQWWIISKSKYCKTTLAYWWFYARILLIAKCKLFVLQEPNLTFFFLLFRKRVPKKRQNEKALNLWKQNQIRSLKIPIQISQTMGMELKHQFTKMTTVIPVMAVIFQIIFKWRKYRMFFNQMLF